MELASIFRDIALLKALYWRMFPVFRWLVQTTSSAGFTQSVVFGMLKGLVSAENDQEMETQIQDTANLGASLSVMEEYLQQYSPSFVGNFAAPNKFSHLDMHQKRSFTRKQAQVKQSAISGKPISALDTMIEL